MCPYVILEVYKPAIWKSWKIGRDLTIITKNLGFKPFKAVDTRYQGAAWADIELHAHVRRRTLRKEDGAQWHQDGDYGHIPMEHGLIFWSNRTPTEFKVWDQIYQPKPFEVVYFSNLDGLHRRPPNAPRKRWLFRQRVELK